jgi:oxygen-independent coproporphyrinogen-3 oxidase
MITLLMNLSVYVHFPFCVKRCTYCDFNTYAGVESLIPDYLGALLGEIECTAKRLKDQYQVHTLYFGGGTPSLLSGVDVGKIITEINNNFKMIASPEITLEANPGSIDLMKLRQYRDSGINRLSVGVQSFQERDLKILGRIHSSQDAWDGCLAARQEGFENLNLDLIFGIPGQTIESWKGNLQRAIQIRPSHLSLYSLGVETGTPLESQIQSRILPEPDLDLEAEMYDWAMDYLQKEGYLQYEISNWSRLEANGRLCMSMHNLQYWKNQPYLGLGAGAHSLILGQRNENVKEIENYINSMGRLDSSENTISPANRKSTQITRWEEIQETMMLGLRLTQQGVCKDEFRSRFNSELEYCFPKQIATLVQQKLLEWFNVDGKQVLRLTHHGRLLGNRVFKEFVGNNPPKDF